MWQWQCQQCSSSAAAVQKWARTSGPLGSVLDCACGTGGQVPASLGSAGEQPRVLLALKGGFNHPRALPLHSRLCSGQGGMGDPCTTSSLDVPAADPARYDGLTFHGVRPQAARRSLPS